MTTTHLRGTVIVRCFTRKDAWWYNCAPLGKVFVSTALLLCLLPFRVALAAKDCGAIQEKSGGAAYQKCLYDRQEETFKQQIAAYALIIEKEKSAVKESYERRINEENFTWKDIDLRLKSEEDDRKDRIDASASDKENAEQTQIERNIWNKLKKLHALTSAVHGNTLKRLKKNMDAQIADLDYAIQNYELRLRQQDLPQRQ